MRSGLGRIVVIAAAMASIVFAGGAALAASTIDVDGGDSSYAAPVGAYELDNVPTSDGYVIFTQVAGTKMTCTQIKAMATYATKQYNEWSGFSSFQAELWGTQSSYWQGYAAGRGC